MRRHLAAILLLTLALVPGVVLAWRARHLEHLGYFHDDGMYWVAAKSLAEGKGYRILSLPGTPWQTKYPPGLPLLLSVVWRAFPGFPGNLPWAMLVAASTLPAFAWVSVRLLEAWGCSRFAAMLVCAWLVLNPYVVFFSINLMPELPVATLIGACLLMARKADQRRSRGMALGAGVVAGLAYLTKTSALPLLLAGPLWFVLRRRARLAPWFAAPPLAAAVAWTAWSVRHTVPSSDITTIYYTSYLGDYLYDLRPWEGVTFFWKNIPTFLASIGNLLIPDTSEVPAIRQNFSRLVGLAALSGCVRWIRRDGAGLQHWFAAGFCALALIWQYPPNERFLLPILPVFAYGAQAEVRHVSALVAAAWRSGKSDRRAVAAMFAVGMAAVCLWGCAMAIAGHRSLLPEIIDRYRAQLASNRKVYEWIERNLPPGEPILASYDAAIFLYTGHPATRLPNFPKQYYWRDREAVVRAYARLPAYARSRGIRHLCVSQTDFDLDPFVRGIIDWKKLTSGGPYRPMLQESMAELYAIEAPR